MRVLDAPEPREGRASTSRVVPSRVIAYPRARTGGDSDDASSSSGEDVSDDDDEDDDDGANDGDDDDVARAATLVSVVGAGDGKQCVVVGSDGVARGVWRALLFAEDADDAREDAHEAFRALVRDKHKPWVVILARGGHFAASAFDARAIDGEGDAPKAAAMRHATARRYVVRAKAGGRQVSKDGGGKNIKSAGSSMRRANEAALEEDMRKTFREWRDVLESASLIFISVSKVDAKTIFNEKNPMLDRKDPRVRRVPFMTGRPTFNETRRVAGRLATVNLNVVEEEEAPRPSAEEEDELSALVDTNFIIAKRKTPAREAEEPEEPEIVVPEPALHAAARDGDADAVFALLVDSNADPTEVYKGKVAYTVSKDKETRDAFRRAMARIPDAWDWMQGARVPSALTPELEAKQAAKEAEYEAAKKEKDKERKKAQKKKKKSAAAALLAKAEEQTAAAAAAATGEKKSAALLGQANKAENDRREQMARAAEARLAAQDAARRSNIGALGGATFRDSTSIGGGSNAT